MYMSSGGHITSESNFGIDPLYNNIEKYQLRSQSFHQICPSFEVVFHEAVNGNKDIFQDNLLLFIDITKRLAMSLDN